MGRPLLLGMGQAQATAVADPLEDTAQGILSVTDPLGIAQGIANAASQGSQGANFDPAQRGTFVPAAQGVAQGVSTWLQNLSKDEPKEQGINNPWLPFALGVFGGVILGLAGKAALENKDAVIGAARKYGPLMLAENPRKRGRGRR